MELPLVGLTDVDGVVFDMHGHTASLVERVAAAFPIIAQALPAIQERRHELRTRQANLTDNEKDRLWVDQYPGTSRHNILETWAALAPDSLPSHVAHDVWRWLTDRANFNPLEFQDTPRYFQDVAALGATAVLCTYGQHTRANGEQGWQRVKINSSPSLAEHMQWIMPTLPPGGKGEVLVEAYDPDAQVFRWQLTVPAGIEVAARQIFLVDDNRNNFAVFPTTNQAFGVLLDRRHKYDGQDLPYNVQIAHSLGEATLLARAWFDRLRPA